MTEEAAASPNAARKVAHFFVDEAGDLNLFDKKGRVLLGTPGVSNYFMVGVAHLHEPELARVRLGALRADLLADPYFKNVPSMQPTAKKTALAFHAKDDVPEVRREVLKILPDLGVKVQVAIRRKAVLVAEAQTLFRYGDKLHANDVYDDLIKRLFRNILHKADKNHIVFAWRGKSARKDALEQAIAHAKQNFARKWGRFYDRPTPVESGRPSDYTGLQVIDYYLWAIQRLYESGEARFFELLAEDYRLIMDIDDKRHKPYGEWYSDANMLTVYKIKDPQTD
jgi:hypothetical protein